MRRRPRELSSRVLVSAQCGNRKSSRLCLHPALSRGKTAGTGFQGAQMRRLSAASLSHGSARLSTFKLKAASSSCLTCQILECLCRKCSGSSWLSESQPPFMPAQPGPPLQPGLDFIMMITWLASGVLRQSPAVATGTASGWHCSEWQLKTAGNQALWPQASA